jgi:pimeloyl-ACP methyl ester carboxylesterase
MHYSYRAALVGAVIVLGGPLADAAIQPTGEAIAKAKSKTSAARVDHWEGTLKVRPGTQLRLVVHDKTDEWGSMAATLDSPDEGIEGLKLDPFTLSPRDRRFSFDLKATAARYKGWLNAEATEAVGTWSQRGVELPLTFKRTRRPTPMPKIVGPEQVWEGKLNVGAGLSMRIAVHVGKAAAGGLMAKMDSPDQGARGLKVDTITLDKATLAFEMKAIDGKFTGKLNAEGTEAVGTWTQAGRSLPLTLKKSDKATELRRPQTPKPPFPYKVVEVAYPNRPAGVTLAGTLSEPEGPGPFPAAILISGSGAQDRDVTLFEHKPFLVLADALTRRGIAVLRLDDRGVGGSTGTTITSTSDDFAGDVVAGLDFLKARREIDPARLGLIGHSEGGIIAPMVAARSSDVAFIVLMAGTGLPGEEILYLQGQSILKAMGANEEDLKMELDLQKRLFQLVKAERDETILEAKLRDAIKEVSASLPEDKRKELADYGALVKGQLELVRSPWFRFFLAYDPRPTLAKVRCPVLAVIGEKDLQVPARENLSEIRSALEAAGNTHVTVRELPGLNHLLQTCRTGAPSEYAQIEETIAPGALAAIVDWVGIQTRSARR